MCTFWWLLVFAIVASIMVSNAIKLPGDGILQPTLYYQRYRQSEYKQEQPFFQWWYYWIRDTENDRHLAMSYGTTLCKNTKVKSCIYDGAIVGVALVDNKQNRRLQKYEFYDRNSFSVNQEFNFKIYNNKNESIHELRPLDDNNFLLIGNMEKENIDNVWVCEGCSKDLEIRWNLTLSRIYGWYAQDVFEDADKWLDGMIMWDTYSHAAEVEGHIKIENDEYIIKKGNTTRAYGDSNWSESMPSAPPDEPPNPKYAWGWYYVNIPADDKSEELSIIAGTGLSYANEFLGTMDARFL